MAQGFRGPPAPVQRKQQLTPKPLSKRLFDDRCFEVADQQGVHTESETSLKEILARCGHAAH